MRCRSEERALPLRIGIVDYLNSKPLAWAFLGDEGSSGYEVRLLSPARVADLLAAGELEVGLIPSIEVQRIPGLRVVAGLGVAATREARSVLLLSRCHASRIRRLALDQNSRTSAALVRILLRDRYGVEPECVTGPPRLDDMMSQADAALIIGDPALRVDRGEFRVLDLAAEWRELTGRPFVFAVWAVRTGVEPEPLATDLRRSRDRGLAEIDELVGTAVRDLGLEPGGLREYLTENLSYDLGDAHIAGLEEFYRRAHRLGLIPPPEPIRLL